MVATLERSQIFAPNADGALDFLQRKAARLPRLLQLLAQLLQHEMQYKPCAAGCGLVRFLGCFTRPAAQSAAHHQRTAPELP